jgi:hypothetical protein
LTSCIEWRLNELSSSHSFKDNAKKCVTALHLDKPKTSHFEQALGHTERFLCYLINKQIRIKVLNENSIVLIQINWNVIIWTKEKIVSKKLIFWNFNSFCSKNTWQISKLNAFQKFRWCSSFIIDYVDQSDRDNQTMVARCNFYSSVYWFEYVNQSYEKEIHSFVRFTKLVDTIHSCCIHHIAYSNNQFQ